MLNPKSYCIYLLCTVGSAVSIPGTVAYVGGTGVTLGGRNIEAQTEGFVRGSHPTGNTCDRNYLQWLAPEGKCHRLMQDASFCREPGSSCGP